MNIRIDLDEYRKFVSTMAASRDAFVSRDVDSAAVIIAKLFDVCQDTVDILTGSLDHQVYGVLDVKRAAQSFLRRNAAAYIRILAEQDPGEGHPFLDALAEVDEVDKDRFEVLIVPTHMQADYNFHFCVGDHTHFRFEPGRNSKEAFAKFGDESTGGRLQSVFDQLHRRVMDAGRAPRQLYRAAAG